MQLHLQTAVRQNYKAVFDGFDEGLFLKLAPPYPQVRLIGLMAASPAI